MEIYVKIEPLEDCFYGPGWWADENDTGCGSCIIDGDDLENKEGNLRGSAAKSWAEAKLWADTARDIAFHAGYGKVRITFWQFKNGKYVKVKPPTKS